MKVRNQSIDHQYAVTRGWVGHDRASADPPTVDDLPLIEELLTAETDTTKVYAPNGVGGVIARADTGGTDGMVPYYIAPAATFTVPIYKQALYLMEIDNAGLLVVEGYLLEVTS